MNKPSETQILGAAAVLRTYARQNGGTAAENVTRAAVYSALSCLTGIGAVAAPYVNAVKDATDGEVNTTNPITKLEDGILVGPNAFGIPEGSYKLINDDDDEFDMSTQTESVSATNVEGASDNTDTVDAVNEDETEDGDGEFDDGADDDEDANELPTKAVLDRMNKDQLAAQIVVEGADVFTGTNVEMVKHILDSRKDD